jgi:LysM domain
MEWRSTAFSVGWAWLEPVLSGVTLLAFLSTVVRGVRLRFRRARRSPTTAFVRRIVTLLGLGLALFASASSASGRTSAHPGRSARPLLEAPWRGTSGFPPPHPLVPSGSPMAPSPATHPAIHKGASGGRPAPLFERAGRRGPTQREESRRLHPTGNPNAVEVGRGSFVTVRDGDCLWTIAADILNSDSAQRIDAYWRTTFRINRAVIGPDPNRLLPGQVLRLPKKATG